MSLSTINGSMPNQDQSTTVLLHDLSELLFYKTGASLDRGVSRSTYRTELASGGRQPGINILTSRQPQRVDVARLMVQTDIALVTTDSENGKAVVGSYLPTQIIFNVDLVNDSAETVLQRIAFTKSLVMPAYTAGLPQTTRMWSFLGGNQNIIPVTG